jgi:hypothetical protein
MAIHKNSACDVGTIILIVIIILFSLAICAGISWCIYDCCSRNNKNKKKLIAIGREYNTKNNDKNTNINNGYYGASKNSKNQDNQDNQQKNHKEDEEEYDVSYETNQNYNQDNKVKHAYENTKKYINEQGSKIGKRVEQSFSEGSGPDLPINNDYSNTITQDESYMLNSAKDCGAVWGGLLSPDDNTTNTGAGYNGTLNVNKLMPASWRSAEPCSALTDTDTSQWSSYAPSKQGFDNYITTAGSARLAVNTRTAMSRQTGLPNMLKDRIQGGGGPPVPLGANAMTFNDSDLRQSLLYDATGIYPELTWC